MMAVGRHSVHGADAVSWLVSRPFDHQPEQLPRLHQQTCITDSPMIISPRCVGNDVSKRMLDIFDDAIGTAKRIANAHGHHRAGGALAMGNVLVVFEATGVYDRELAKALHQAGVRFARIKPARRDFAQAHGRLAKTDEIDARMLACFARTMAPAADQPPEPERNTWHSLQNGGINWFRCRPGEKPSQRGLRSHHEGKHRPRYRLLR